ncbi:hypothetical protein [Nocardia sp. NBC_01377]|uniref:hypothetical protein n=1 Tax=Nocardia sp. NBC_01377 TaxID=2903595 RepID=UPI00386A6C7D
MSDLVNLDTDTETAPVRQTAAHRRALPDFTDIAAAAAEEFGVCVRPITMASVDPITGKTEYVGSPCKATIASVCKPRTRHGGCASLRAARAGTWNPNRSIWSAHPRNGKPSC